MELMPNKTAPSASPVTISPGDTFYCDDCGDQVDHPA
jgi:hypothetical protein